MKNRYIYILVEVARRELDSRLALALQLVEEGCTIFIGEKNQLLWNMFCGFYPPGVIFDKCAQLAEHKYFQRLLKQGFRYTVLDEEGTLTNREYFNLQRFSKRAERDVMANFVSGSELNRYILIDYPKSNNIVSGNPRYSMLHSEWAYWFQDELIDIKKYGSFVLLLSSFNNYPSTYKNALPGMREIDDFFKEEMRKYIEEVDKTKTKLILRPHPSDQPFEYKDVIIDDRYNVIPWIMAADLIINAKCTTSLEAFIAKKENIYTWKFKTTEKAYKLANIFADDVKEIGNKKSLHSKSRRTQIIKEIIAFHDSPSKPFDIIKEKLLSLSFETTRKPIKIISIDRVLNLKNFLLAFLKGDNYSRITNKFTDEHIKYALKKINLNSKNLTTQVNKKIIEISREERSTNN